MLARSTIGLHSSPERRLDVSGSTLAVDAGQSGVRVALSGAGDPRLAEGPGVPRMDATRIDAEAVAAALLSAVDRLDPAPAAVEGVGVGLSGFEVASEADLETMADRLTARVPATRVVICTDGVTSLLGALGDRVGAVVAAGTGTVAMAFDGDRWAKVDGTGSLLGDAGSGFEIGKAGLDSALRFHDGRGGSEPLALAAAERFGALDQIPRQVSLADVPTRTVAGFARDVARVAGTGDSPAVQILKAAGRELAVSACAAAGRLFDPEVAVAVSYTGEVFKAGPALFQSFAQTVEELRPGTRVSFPIGGSLDGAALAVQHSDRLEPAPGVLWKRA